MKELNKVLINNADLHSWPLMRDLLEEVFNIYEASKADVFGKELNPNFDVNTLSKFNKIFPIVQGTIETNIDLEMGKRIEIASNSAEIFAFLMIINELSEDSYRLSRNDIYFEFVAIIGKFYIENLMAILRSAKIL